MTNTNTNGATMNTSTTKNTCCVVAVQMNGTKCPICKSSLAALAPFGLPSRFEGAIYLDRVIISQGYGDDGRYYGTGLPVFELTFDGADGSRDRIGVRAVDRKSLRNALKVKYPTAKVSR